MTAEGVQVAMPRSDCGSMPPQPRARLPSHPAHPAKPVHRTEAQSAHRGNFFSSLFTLVNVILGTGMLTLPYSFAKAGVATGFLIMLVYGSLLFSTAYVVVCISDLTGAQSFEAIVHRLLGPRAGVVTSVMVAVYAFFMSTSCLIIVADMAGPMAHYVAPDAHEGFTAFAVRREAHILLGAILALPAMLMKDFTALRFTSLLAFCCLIFVVGVVTAYYFKGVDDDAPVPTPQNASSLAISEAGGSSMNLWPESIQIIYSIPNIALSLTCQLQIAAIYPEMEDKHRSPAYFTKVMGTAYALVLIVYIPITIFGYMTFPHNTPPNILEGDYPASDWAIMLSRGCLMLVAICTMPLNHHPCRSALRDLWDAWWAKAAEKDRDVGEGTGLVAAADARSHVTGRTGTDFTSHRHIVPPRDMFFYVECFGAWLVMIGIACVVPTLSVLCSIINFTAGVLIMFIFPGVFLRNVEELPYAYLPSSRAGLSRLGAFYIVWGVLSGIVAFASFLEGTFFDRQ
eukprot:TRINITY_DN1983_c0_g1_i1.p1 TRINITY_DN1983_c0_g1~~TRINITY_DN1983_c0_g1_i1.p1  ORF type:complete len:512 (+),score=110.33 TRINITY_DN1983_c0_g1_i1:49-1584(+)